MGKTGYVEWRGPANDKQWYTRVKDKATGKLLWKPLEADLPAADRLRKDQQDLSEKYAGIFQEQWAAGNYVPIQRGLTVAEFFKRWCDSRRSRLANQVVRDEAAFRLWIGPELGSLPMHGVTRDRLIAFSHHLDTKALKGEDFGGKRARNIFSVVSAMFRDAFKSKDPTLRILEMNPCADVPWPEPPEGDPLHQLLYPREFLALVSCPKVPRIRARLYAVSLYTTTRVGEARMLECKDIDIDNALVMIVKAADSGKGKRGKKKLTKSGKSRLCSLERTLAPLLEVMIEERGGKGRIFPDRPTDMPKGNQHRRMPVDFIPGTSKVCEMFRRDLLAALKWAGIKVRPELVDDSSPRESQPIRFHDLRASGITWRHARGDTPAAIRQECGHQDERTNEIYIRRLRELRPNELFPALPERLMHPETDTETECPSSAHGAPDHAENADKSCRRRESKIIPGDAYDRVIAKQADESSRTQCPGEHERHRTATSKVKPLAKVASGARSVRVEVDGRIAVGTDIVEGEYLGDVEARLRLGWEQYLRRTGGQ